MTTSKPPRPYLDPYAAGALLGVVLFAAFYVTGGGLGASAALSRVQTGALDLVAPGHVDRVAYFAELAGGLRSPWGAGMKLRMALVVRWWKSARPAFRIRTTAKALWSETARDRSSSQWPPALWISRPLAMSSTPASAMVQCQIRS